MTRLTLKTAPPVRVAVDHLSPERLAGKSAAEIARLPLCLGNQTGQLGDWFAVAGETGDELVLEGDCARLDRIGAGMTRGTVTVRGDAGAYLGAAMRGGRIDVEGAAGYGVATAMRGGTIAVRGDAGDAVAGALPGERGGMRGGVVVIGGKAGNAVADRMRRGLVVVGGDVGEGCGARMIAGTVVVGGRLGLHPGAGMRRGSVVALGGAARLPATFADCGIHDLVVIRLLARSLGNLGLAELAGRLDRLRRWTGDLAAGGKGELLLR